MAAGKHGVDVPDGVLAPLATCGNPVVIGVNASAEVVEDVSESMQDAQQPVKHINVNVMGHMVVEKNGGVACKLALEWNTLY